MGQSCTVEHASKVVGYVPKRRTSFSSVKGNLVVLKESCNFEQEYTLGDNLGKDDAVWRATNNENEIPFAMRRIEKESMPLTDTDELTTHLQNLRSLRHMHICSFVEAFESEDHIDLIYEMASSKSLFDQEKALMKGKPLKEELVRHYAQQITMALVVAHRNGVVHGRLCETSILYDTCEIGSDDAKSIKLCDFGQTFFLRPPRASESVSFTSPEVLSEEREDPNSPTSPKAAGGEGVMGRAAADMWALGILIFTMMTGAKPFEANNEQDLVQAIKRTSVDFEPHKKIWAAAPEAKEVIRSLLMHSTKLRCTAEKLLKHPWIQKDRERVSRSKMLRVLTNVVANSNESTFKKFVMRVIAEDMPPEKIETVQAAFRSLDKNGGISTAGVVLWGAE
jgi:serine/threonine protein kinase